MPPPSRNPAIFKKSFSQQAHMEQQTLAEERAARFAAEQFATQISYMMQQEAWGRTALKTVS